MSGAIIKPILEISADDLETLACLRKFIDLKGYPPTRTEMKQCLGVTSTSTVQRRIRRLVVQGLIVVEPGARALRIVE
jgi:SOS-response transcriptional repressor LexA